MIIEVGEFSDVLRSLTMKACPPAHNGQYHPDFFWGEFTDRIPTSR